jgi:hypothetical protein
MYQDVMIGCHNKKGNLSKKEYAISRFQVLSDRSVLHDGQAGTRGELASSFPRPDLRRDAGGGPIAVGSRVHPLSHPPAFFATPPPRPWGMPVSLASSIRSRLRVVTVKDSTHRPNLRRMKQLTEEVGQWPLPPLQGRFWEPDSRLRAGWPPACG